MNWLRRWTVALVGVGMVLVSAPAGAVAAGEPAYQATASPTTECSAAYFHDDRRLGPAVLPKLGAVGVQLIGYRRTGGLPPQRFLDTYYDPSANGGQGGWRYPPADGYVIGPDGRPLVKPSTLVVGQRIDRYGSEFGQFLAPLGSPYASRSIPPQSLVSSPAEYCNYRAYRVLKPFTVDSGPIAPWFAQPGRGWQYQLKTAHIPGAPSPLNVKWLLDNGYLQRVSGPPQAMAERDLPAADRALSTS